MSSLEQWGDCMPAGPSVQAQVVQGLLLYLLQLGAALSFALLVLGCALEVFDMRPSCRCKTTIRGLLSVQPGAGSHYTCVVVAHGCHTGPSQCPKAVSVNSELWGLLLAKDAAEISQCLAELLFRLIRGLLVEGSRLRSLKAKQHLAWLISPLQALWGGSDSRLLALNSAVPAAACPSAKPWFGGPSARR